MVRMNPEYWDRIEVTQKAIDSCDHFHGCNRKCTKEAQASCEKLKAHSDALRYVEENKIPMWIE